MKLVYLLFFISIANFSPGQWVKTNGPLGISIEAFHNRNNILFAGTDPHGIYKSFDHGLHWFESNTALTKNLEITCFASDKLYLFAGSLEDGVFRSPDDGNTWEPCNTGVHPSGLSSLLVANGYLFAGTILDGIYRSRDHGTTWQNINQGLLDFTYIISMVCQDHRLMVEGDNYIFFSYDNGNTWDIDNGPTAFYPIDNFFHHGDTLLASTGIIIFRSTDGGVNWVGPQIMSSSLCGFDSKGDTVYAGCRAGVYRSLDWGQSWTLLASPDLRIGSRYQHDFVISGSNLITGYGEIGAYVSRNKGASWKQVALEQFTRGSTIDDAMIVNNGVLYTGTHSNGVFKTTDQGDNWVKIGTPNDRDTLSNAVVFALLHVDTSILLAGSCDYGMYRSKDNGATWTHITAGLPKKNSKWCVTTLAISGPNIIAALADGVYYSTNKGLGWHKSQIQGGITVLEASGLAVRNNIVCVGIIASPGRGIYRSTDYGKTFALADPLLDIARVKEGGDKFMYAGSLFSVHRSADNGRTWGSVGPGIPPGGGAFTILAWDNYVFVGNNYGVFFSNDFGSSFSDVSLGLDPYPHNVVSGLARDGVYLYAGTEKNAVWKRSLNDFGIVTPRQNEVMVSKGQESDAINNVLAAKVFPNPFTDRLIIRIETNEATKTAIRFSDLEGKKYFEQNKTLHPGRNYISMEKLDFLPAGTYLVEVISGNSKRTFKVIK